MKDKEDKDTADSLSKDEGGLKEPVQETLDSGQKRFHVSGMYKNWFLDYASYVILERAVPDIRDGLKPVQRRILHALKELDDGRFNKAANIIGHTMKYHPHGDASIGDALVQLGQKDILIETQGNWGNILTGDSAAAPRYIEARLSKFALEVLFSPKITLWQSSYDGRGKEPSTLPVKFPLLLAQGVEGIAVGLNSKILPHNFLELIDASIDYLKGKVTEIFPDFPTGGMADISKYNDGIRGSRVRIRARIGQADKKTLVITEIPFGTTTSSLIDSIVSANDKGKIKIRKIEDNTAEKVEILIHLLPGVSPDTTIDALYAFTNCEVSISPVGCVIDSHKPRFLGVKDILASNTDNTLDVLKRELEIEKAEALEKLHFTSLERIFIEKEIYLKIRKSRTDEEINDTILKGLKPFTKDLIREVTLEDVMRLRKIPIDRISKYNSDKADDHLAAIKEDIKQFNFHLKHLVDYAIEYFKRIRKKYGKGRERRTELRSFDTIQATMVAAATQKLYVNREEGFAGFSLKKDEFVSDCSDIDDMIVFRTDGTFSVFRVNEKVFVGKDILHIDIFKKLDDRTIYNMVYQDGKNGNVMVKRFAVKGVTREKEYSLTKGTANSKVLYFTANPNGEAEIVSVNLRPKLRLKILQFDFDFSSIAIKGRDSIGNILSKNSVRKIVLKDEGISTLGARDIWYDDTVNRLNVDQRGAYIGAFDGDDRIITLTRSGFYKIYQADITAHFDDDVQMIEKYKSGRVYTVVYFDGSQKLHFVKRFNAEITDKRLCFISEENGSELISLSKDQFPVAELVFQKKDGKQRPSETIPIADFIGVKSSKAKGKRLSSYAISRINMLEPLPSTEKPDTGSVFKTRQGADIEQPDTIVKNKNEQDSSNQNKKSRQTSLQELSAEKPDKEESGKKNKTEVLTANVSKKGKDQIKETKQDKPDIKKSSSGQDKSVKETPSEKPKTPNKKTNSRKKGKGGQNLQIEFEF